MNLVATWNLFALTLHSVPDCLCDLWRQCRDKACTRRNFLEELCFLTTRALFPDRTALLETMLGRRQPLAVPT
ncbi:MAG: hypothetical protein OXN97_22370 [Bryobacterales bacterium]|nr:hypothetical protein [Bryobacterales bacterium]